MQQFIAKIGKGHKRTKDLTWDEAKESMRTIIESQATPGQIGAFLMAMRIKTESISELASFTAAARHYVPPLKLPSPSQVVDVPMYGEKHDTCHAIVASALIAAAAGAPILIHGTSNTAAASTVPDILQQLGISITQPVEQLTQFQFAYLDLETYHPPLAKLLDLRHEFGVQNLSHQVARMLNPARASSQVIGIAHPPYLDKMIEALHMLGTPRVMVLQGVEGAPELSISTATPARELRNDHITRLMIRPQDIGLSFGAFQAMGHSSLPHIQHTSIAQQEAALIRQLLQNPTQGDYRAWVILNAALLLYAAGKASSLVQATPLAEHTLDSGMALKKLQALTTQSSLSTETLDLPTETVSA
ncbi:MAG: anthranilate phosphoribosyltransferase [Nitrospirales bacterium]|nr:MAG: anthranilate phosphoribosyltransferase [Nitrospirales bacterium]